MLGEALARLADRTGEPGEKLREWLAHGLIAGRDDESDTDVERVRLVRFLLERGFDLEVIATAHVEQDGLIDRFVELLYPWGGFATASFAELQERAEFDPALAERMWRAAGLSPRDDGVGDDDFEALTTLATALDVGIPEDAVLQMIRVYADALRRVAEAEVGLVHFYIHERFRADGLSSTEATHATRAVSNALLAAVEPTVLYFHRKGWVSANRDDLALHVAEASGDSRPGAVPGRLSAAVVFTDLARFTPLTEAMGDHAAAAVVDRFSEIVRTATTACRGRVVKQIGDAFMLVFFDPRAAVECALQIDERATNESHFPAVRSSAHWGEVLYREGDYVGATVNVAARLGARAAAHEVLVTSTLATEVGELPGATIEPLGTRRLKGVHEDLDLCLYRRGAASQVDRVVDPVCGMEMPSEHAAARLEIEGEIRAFCSGECLQRFVAAPERYGLPSRTPDQPH
jgi:adenylate cyclase